MFKGHLQKGLDDLKLLLAEGQEGDFNPDAV